MRYMQVGPAEMASSFRKRMNQLVVKDELSEQHFFEEPRLSLHTTRALKMVRIRFRVDMVGPVTGRLPANADLR